MRVFHWGEIVQHFKRETLEDKNSPKYLYKLLCEAYHCETDESYMVYQALYCDEEEGVVYTHYIRPKSDFMGKVDHSKYPNIKQTYKFEKYEGSLEDVRKMIEND